MQPSYSRDVDLLFIALHETSLRCSPENLLRSQMTRGFYFYDQVARVSHIGGIHRYKRHPEELNQALHYVKVALASDDNEPAKAETTTPATTVNQTPSPVKQFLIKQSNDILLRTLQQKLSTPISPDHLFRELDGYFLQYEDKTKRPTSSSTPGLPPSVPSKSPLGNTTDGEQEVDPLVIQEADDADELMAASVNVPKVSLPAQLIISLHATWTDLIENTEYTYKVWRTKAAEDSWRRYVDRRRHEQLNAEKYRSGTVSKQILRRQSTSRASASSLTNPSRSQHHLATNNQFRSNRSTSRVSFISTNNGSPTENMKIGKPAQIGSMDSLPDSVKSGVHIEFKLSIQADETKQQKQSQIQAMNEHRGVTFDVPKPNVDVYEDIISLLQTQCKRLLAETRQKILKSAGDPNAPDVKICKVWFYGENQHIRTKSNLLTLNESARKQRSKYIFALLRREIPDQYSVEINIPENKHKCYLELIDGSIQIYYPSGRLAVLRTSSPHQQTLFFDDTDSLEHRFLGVISSNGGVVIMQPTFHARFVTDLIHERGYLCNGKVGVIEKQLQWHLNNAVLDTTINPEDEDSLPPLLDNIVQLQLNPSMQFEYRSPTNIRFAFSCHREEFKYQLGSNSASITPSVPQTPILLPKKTTQDKKFSKAKQSANIHSLHLNEIPPLTEKQQLQVERLLDGQVNIRELPMIRELYNIRKRIRNICNNWLKYCRSTLGVLDIDAYCLPDWPTPSNKLLASVRTINPSKSAKPPRQILMPTKAESINSEFLKPSEKAQITRTLSARKPEQNVIENTIMQFLPRSNNGRMIKEKIISKKSVSPVNLPSIKQNPIPTIIEEASSSRAMIPHDIPFACPNLIRNRLIQDGPTSTILYDSCACRADHVPLIHDLEFDTFIQTTKQLNPKQLVVVGIINSNLRQIENEQESRSNELYEVLQTLNYHRNYGRSQICSCRLATSDDYRCLVYDLSQATKQSSLYGPLLVRRHRVQPGFVLIYQNGQLVFGDFIFNGYGRNVEDLEKQLNRMRQQQLQSTGLPDQFKFVADYRRADTTVLKSI